MRAFFVSVDYARIGVPDSNRRATLAEHGGMGDSSPMLNQQQKIRHEINQNSRLNSQKAGKKVNSLPWIQ